jgi:hypothetical protein
LYAYKNQVLNKDIYLPWLHKYKALYDDTSGNENRYAAYDAFHSLYFSIQELEELLEFSDQAEQALEEFSELQHEEEVLFWLSKYEELGHQLMFFTSLRCETESEDVILPFSMDQFNIDPIDFLYHFRFNFLFDNNYYPMLDKYITYDVEELKDYLNVDDGHFHPQVTSLTYHLRRRGILPL